MNSNRQSATFKVSLITGEIDGIWHVSKGNWSAHAWLAPRDRYRELKELVYKKLPSPLGALCIYVLIGPEEDDPTFDTQIYIGQTSDLITRLDNHRNSKDKSFWNRVAVFSEPNLTILHGTGSNYLEAKLAQLARETKVSKVLNKNDSSNLSSLSEIDVQQLDIFLNNIRLTCPVIGVEVFHCDKVVDDNRYLYLRGDPNTKGIYSNRRLRVLKDSVAKTRNESGFPSSSSRYRDHLEAKKILKDIDGKWLLMDDHVFNSPSQAAQVMLGRAANGWREWKSKDGTPLDELFDRPL